MEIKEQARGNGRPRISDQITQSVEVAAASASPSGLESRNQQPEGRQKADFRAYYDMKPEEIQQITENSMSSSGQHGTQNVGLNKSRQTEDPSQSGRSSGHASRTPVLGPSHASPESATPASKQAKASVENSAATPAQAQPAKAASPSSSQNRGQQNGCEPDEEASQPGEARIV